MKGRAALFIATPSTLAGTCRQPHQYCSRCAGKGGLPVTLPPPAAGSLCFSNLLNGFISNDPGAHAEGIQLTPGEWIGSTWQPAWGEVGGPRGPQSRGAGRAPGESRPPSRSCSPSDGFGEPPCKGCWELWFPARAVSGLSRHCVHSQLSARQMFSLACG